MNEWCEFCSALKGWHLLNLLSLSCINFTATNSLLTDLMQTETTQLTDFTGHKTFAAVLQKCPCYLCNCVKKYMSTQDERMKWQIHVEPVVVFVCQQLERPREEACCSAGWVKPSCWSSVCIKGRKEEGCAVSVFVTSSAFSPRQNVSVFSGSMARAGHQAKQRKDECRRGRLFC